MAASAEGFPACFHGAILFPLLARWRIASRDQPGTGGMARIAEGRLSQPTAGVIDSQSVKTTETTSLSGYDASKRIKGRKRRITIDTSDHMIALTVHGVHIQDRDGAPRVFARLRREAPKRRHVFADSGYDGPKLYDALIDIGRRTIQIVKRSTRLRIFLRRTYLKSRCDD
jgi:transposase